MDQIEEIKQKLNIVDVVSSYLPLKKAGRNFKALCPFHAEKTPSFIVSSERQIWHCFGCSEGGDIFSFVMKMEGVEFAEALRILARKAGVRLKKIDPTVKNKKVRLYEINEWAAKYFQKVLQGSPGPPAGETGKKSLEYLKERGLTNKTISSFGLGFAPDVWHHLSNFLKSKGYGEKEIYDAGLTVEKEQGRYYDRFRGRIMFPIFNIYGDIVGFGGRIFNEGKQKTADVAKYINTPQTLIYDKSRTIYGLDKAKTEIRKKDKVIVVEGYMDVLPSHQAGVCNVVSSSGTALTEGQIGLISRYTKNINLAFDVDLAGDEATRRGIELAIAKGMNVKIIQIAFGSDPGECIKKDVALWKKSIDNALYFIDFYFQSTFNRIAGKKKELQLEDKKKIAAELLPVIRKIPDKIEQSHYVQKLAGRLSTEEKVIYDALKNIKEKRRVYSAKEAKGKTSDKLRVVQENLLGLVLTFPENIKHLVTNLEADCFTYPDLQNIYKLLQSFYTKEDVFSLDEFRKKLDKNLSYKVDMITLSIEHFYGKIKEDLVAEEIDSYILRLNKIKLEKEKKQLEEEIREAESQGQKEKINKLMAKFQKITKK